MKGYNQTDTPNNQLLLSGVALQLLGGTTPRSGIRKLSPSYPNFKLYAGWYMEKYSAVITVDVWDIISEFYGGRVSSSPNSWLILVKEM